MYKAFFLLLLILSLFFTSCIFDYNDYKKDAGDSGATYSITGSFVNRNGNAIAGLRVQLTGDSLATAVTDNAGGYVFSNLPSGTYTVTPGDNGYGPKSVLISNSDITIPINNDGHGGNINGDFTCSGCHGN